jgi:inositol transporter-like SP family MFS transporter
MASYIDAVAIVSSGTALTIYTQVFGLSTAKLGGLASTLTLFIAVGAIVGGRLGDRYGRKRVFMVTMVVIALGSLLTVIGSTFTVLAIGIGLMGLGTGADLPVSIATIAESAEEDQRGKLVSFSQILWTVGIILSGVFGTIFGDMGRTGGQILFGHVGLAALIVFILRFTIPESREWEAARSDEMRGEGPASGHEGLGHLLRKPYLRPFLALLFFYALTNITVNTDGQFGTYMLVNLGGLDVSTASAIFTGCSVFGIVLTYVFMKTVDTRFRMTVFAVGAVTGVVSWLLPALFGATTVPLVSQMILIFVFNGLAFEAMMKVWTQETFPTLLRSTAQGSIIAIARFLAAAAVSVTPTLLAFSPRLTAWSQVILMAIGLVCALTSFRTGEYVKKDELASAIDGGAHSRESSLTA